MKKSFLSSAVCLFFLHFLCSAQNSIIVGPQNDCSQIRNNISISKSKFNVEGVSQIKIETFQHRTYDKSRIYNEYGNILWEWKGESHNDTWYKKEHFLNINSKFIEIEFYQGYSAPFCNGYIKVSKIVNGIVPSSSNTPQKPYSQAVGQSVSRDLSNQQSVQSAIEFQVVSRTYEFGNLEYAQSEFSEKMDWNTAIATCAKLGEGWRLPTKEEFNTFFQSGRGIRLLGSYWSSTEANNDEAWGKNYYYHVVLKESEFLYPKREPRQILVVRDLSYKHRGLELVKSRIIGNPIEIDNLLVAQFDYPQNLDWDNANKACQSLGDGWRLPTKDELDTLYKNRTKIGGFFDKSYWSSTEYTSNHACFQNFGNGIQYDGNNHGFKTGNILYVRAVRNKIKAELFVGNPIKSQSVGQSTSQTDLIRRSPSQVCNWKPTRPKLSFVLVDNREACDCCNARYARYSISTTSNIQSKKNQHEIEYINAIMQKHLENSNADKNHIEADRKKFDEFVTKTYGASLLTILQSGLAGYTNMIYSLFGADPIKDTQKKVGRYNIVSDYCSNLCQNRCY